MSNKPIKVFCRISSNADCGVAYYRQWLPLVEAQRKGLVDLRVCYYTHGKKQNETTSIVPDKQEIEANMAWADIIYYSRNDTPAWFWEAEQALKIFKKPTAVDFDDNVQHTRPVNPGYISYHAGSPHIKMNFESVRDGGNGKVYSAITCSTKHLYDFYSPYAKNIYICPNSLSVKEREEFRKEDYSKSELWKKDKDEIRIGWSGSASHYENLKYISKVINDILKNHDNTTFYYTGLFGGIFEDETLKNRIHTVPFVHLEDYPKMLNEMNLDIALAPLTDCNFNRSKSNLRILEYASCKYPVIASNVEPYKTFKGIIPLCTEKEEWYKSIEELVINKDKRKQIAYDCYKKYKKDYDVEKNCVIWVKALKDIIKKFNKENK